MAGAAMARRSRRPLLLPLLLLGFLLLAHVPSAAPQSFIGINYGDVADNLPPPSSTARLLKSTTIGKVRLYRTDPAVVTAFAGTGISLLLGAANGDIPNFASSPSAAAAWVASHLPSTSSPAINGISVGNEVLFADDATLAAQLVPALQNVYDALPPNSSIKVSTVNAMDVLASSDPPSSGTFKPALAAALDPLLAFLSKTGSPFLVNPYPYFAYQDDPRPDTLAFCLFQPNAGRPDAGSGLTYTSMFDAQVDAVRAALDAKGYKDVEVVVAETGWPHSGGADEAGASVENARAFVSGLVSHLRSMVGTPRMPGKSVDTYLFAVYDEDLKPGKASEKSFGLFQTTLTETYPTGLMRNGTAGLAPAPAPTPAQKVPPATPQVTPTPPVQPGAAAASSRHTRSAAESSRTFSALHLFACFGFMALLV
ncbi:glucan endo-1,3-beta-glucosidase 7-like [Lolium rigidum]|uniref:glucan endo-1,3-beta-glucosidase 7-like n=1 Tax=Lolium rigidum TaxID=89674 RepID=UPI001F5D0A2B|nr:glucan endo-1,3-beta-glucosidase 7-like [Lolium rigidum]XP_047088464.1 glucan endo-1,3-beta-glucosidase 7-like [Lolium rigidum]